MGTALKNPRFNNFYLRIGIKTRLKTNCNMINLKELKNENLATLVGAKDRGVDGPIGRHCLVIDEKIVYNNNEVKKMLDIGDERLRKFRDEGYLSYVKYPNSDKYWYTKQNILDFLNNPIAIHKAWK